MIGAAPIELVVFDLDGTLVDTAPDLAVAVNATLAEFGLPQQPEERLHAWIGGGGRMLVRRALAGGGPAAAVDDAFAEAAYRRFTEHYAACLADRSRPYPGAREVLTALAARGMALGCATNKPARFTEPLLAALALDGAFAVVVSGDTLPVMKPDPAPLLHAAERCGLAPAAAVMIGDTLADLRAARAARYGAMIWARWGYADGEDVAGAGPDAIAEALVQIPSLI